MSNESADAVLGIVVRASLEDYMFERLDNLHRRGIHDNEVIRFLRKEGLNDIAARYIEWSGAIDPDAEDDNTTTNPAVPDSGDMPSYANLEQALVDAYKENRIDNGVFYAERSSDGVHWHVYKKRNADDNGAYIATANDRNGAQFILNSLGTGITNFTEKD